MSFPGQEKLESILDCGAENRKLLEQCKFPARLIGFERGLDDGSARSLHLGVGRSKRDG